MEKIGVESLFLTDAFTKGVKTYNDGLKSATATTKGAAAETTSAGSALSSGISAAMGIAGTAVSVAATVIVGALAMAGTAVIGFTSLMVKLGIEARNMENIEFAFSRMAGTVGLSLDKMRAATKGTVSDDEMLIAANKALLGASAPLAQAFGQDLPRLMELAKVAAKTTGTSYEEALNTIVGAIKRGTTRGLPLLGFTIDMKEAENALGESMDGVATSSAAQEKQLAILNAIMGQSDAYLKTFAGSGEALSGKMSRASAIFSNIKDTLGQFFVPALKTAFDAINRLLTAFDQATQEGGSLYNTFVQLAAVFSLVADGFSAGVDMLLGATTDATGGITDTIMSTIDAAFSWGLNLVTNFAVGIINGATSVLQTAINFISGMLSSWFSPGSPPKVSPMIDKWGAATMDEFLQGFTQADFSILKEMQAPLKSILDTLVSGGAMSKVAGKQAFFDISQAMIGGLAGGDLSGAFSQITNAAGTYGVELVKLIKLNVQYANAQRAVAAAEKAVNDAKAKENRLNTNLSLQLMEYNDLARAGASPEVLAAKLAGVNATEDQLIAAQSETKAAEDQQTAAKDQLDSLKEQMDLQKDLVNALIDMAKAQDEVTQAQKEAAKAGAAGGAGVGAGAGITAPGLPAMDWTGVGTTLQDTLSKAIDAAKLAIQTKLAGMWQMIQDEVSAKLAPALAIFVAKWNELVTLLTPIWETIKANFAGFLSIMQGWWDEHGRNVVTVFTAVWNGISTFFSAIWDGIVAIATGKAGLLLQVISNVWEMIKTWFINGVLAIQTIFKGGLDIVGQWFDIWAAIFQGNWELAWNRIVNYINTVGELMNSLMGIVLNNFKALILAGLRNMADVWTAAADLGRNIVQGIGNAITGAGTWLANQIKSMVNSAIDAAKKALGIKSPSTVFFAIGENMMLGMAEGIQSLGNLPAIQVGRASTAAAFAPAMASQPVSTSYRNSNVNMGGVNIYNGMGAGELAATIRNILRSEMAGA